MNYTGPYHAFKQIWSLKITVIVDKYVNKDLRFSTYFLKHSGNRKKKMKLTDEVPKTEQNSQIERHKHDIC